MIILLFEYLFSFEKEKRSNGNELNGKNQVIDVKKEEFVIHDKIQNEVSNDLENNKPNSRKNKSNIIEKNVTKINESRIKINEEKFDSIPIKNYNFTDVSNERLEKYISALNSESLKKNIWKYINKKDHIVSMEKKREKIEKILESTESEELIEYKLRELE